MYYKGGAITTKLIRPTGVVLGADEYFIENGAKVTDKNGAVNIYIVYKLLPKTISTDNALKNCLFGLIESARPDNATDPYNFSYSGYGIGFNHTGTFTHPEDNLARNVTIFGADMSRSFHASNKT